MVQKPIAVALAALAFSGLWQALGPVSEQWDIGPVNLDNFDE